MRSRTTDITFTPAEPIGTISASSSSARPGVNDGGRLRETAIRKRSEVRSGTTGGRPVLNVSPITGWATAPAVSSPESGPVRSQSATCTAQSSRGGSENSRVPSSGSTIQTRSASQAGLVVLALLAEHRIAGTVLREQAHQQLVGGAVAGILQLAALQALAADLEQPVTGRVGQPGCERVVVHGGLVSHEGQPLRVVPGAGAGTRS